MNSQEAKKLQQKGLKILKKYISEKDRVVAGISGGPDSTFLLRLLKQIPCKTVVAHINHGIRGKESDSDEKFVKELSKNFRFHFHQKKIDTPALSKKNKKGIEETARKIRYDFFEELAKKYKAKYILTAHHADDNIETILFNFTRGATLKGISGISELEMFDGKKTPLLRPLLIFSKKQITDYLNFKKIKFCIDKTNENTIYKRNLIRKKVIPNLKLINPSLIETVAKNSQNLREILDYLQQSATEWISENTLNKELTKFNTKPFRTLPEALKKAILIEIYKNFAGNLTRLEVVHLDEVLKIINQNVGNKKKKLVEAVVTIKNNIFHIS
ncbi:tRNA lysidine(34) synthetase TilS [Candidatus Peregrinibacteria bacterium RIFCSPLOWO2_01_FULL_39_12]|nr:MAG: tRNA lysidine(34) synthetase TilS [Candidatus Peregrinibacteria bacterium RIFCSPLOWO2_01_FULL_39_12]